MYEVSEDWPSISEFYNGRSVFITGASGFIGQVLIEKILRSCPKVREIFMLMRPKKNASIDDRLQKLLKQPMYDRLAKENPTFVEKLIPVQGDVALEGLGLSPAARQLLTDRVSIIFHAAANVRFDDSLKHAVFVNTRSTRDICILASQMKNLVALVHVSSTYAHTDKQVVDEILYPPVSDWRKCIKIVETIDEMTLRALTPKYLRHFPNTYTFTKRLAEQVIIDHSKDLPCVLFRPSIVVGSIAEPVPGWICNFNGPNGLMVGGGKGILRVLLAEPDIRSDYIPVDVAVRAMIATSWVRGMQTLTRDPAIHVYNCAGGDLRMFTMREMINVSLQFNSKIPIEGAIWEPSVTITKSPTLYFLLVLLWHVIPALLLDVVLRCYGIKPIVMRLQRKVYISNTTLSYFIMNDWIFRNNNFREILERSPPKNSEDFGFQHTSIDEYTVIKDGLIGGKTFLLGDKMENLENARRHYNRIVWINKAFKVLLFVMLFYLASYCGVVSWLGETLFSVAQN